MKIAVATEDGRTISHHFGRSPFFAIYEVEDGKIINKEMRPNTFTGHFRQAGGGPGPSGQGGGGRGFGGPGPGGQGRGPGGQGLGRHGQGGHGHGPGHGAGHGHHRVAEGLKDCAAVISHGMGRRAWEDLRSRGIEMIVTDETDVEKAVNSYMEGKLEDKPEKLHE
jgi:predicted Fe-Mo cluster-binding NifX family protein